MITLHFNPHYDNGAWAGEPAAGESCIGESYFGPLGLLSKLEIILGVTAKDIPQHEILAVYIAAARVVAKNNHGAFFKESLDRFPLATAKELLNWRDELVLSGWSVPFVIPEELTKGTKQILNGLAEIESNLSAPLRTVSDRWRAVLEALKNSDFVNGLSIVLHVNEEHLHPFYKQLFNQLRRCGVIIREDPADNEPTIELKHFRDSSDAALMAASQGGNALLVCEDAQTLANAQAAFGRHHGKVSASATPRPVEHLFTSAMMLLKDGGNIQALRDYLTAPRHPLNQFKKESKTLRQALLQSIVRQHGLKDVNCLINNFADGSEALKKDIREYLPEPGQPLTFGRISEMCRSLSQWSLCNISNASQNNVDNQYLDQWQSLAEKCHEMESQCLELGFEKLPVINESDFLQVLRTVSESSESKYQEAVIGSAPTVDTIEQIATDVDNVVWVDGSFSEITIPLSFFCPEDVQDLSKALPDIWQQKDAILLSNDLFNAGLRHIKGKLFIMVCDTFRGEYREKHPFILRQLASQDLKVNEIPFETIPAETSEECTSWPADTTKEQYTIDAGSLTIPDHESPTSLEGMFDQPFDWVAGRVLSLYDESDSSLSIIEGLVAHDVIHRICIKMADSGTKANADAFESILKADFDVFFAEAVLNTGAELNLPENILEREQLKEALKSLSLPRLVEIIRCSGLEIAGSELRFDNVDITEPGYEPLKVSGAIDMLLKNKSGHYVILDFKWSGSTGRKERETEIKKGTDYQLALYRKVAETGAPLIPRGIVDASAFYMLKSAELFTASENFRDSKGAIIPVEPTKKWPGRMAYADTITEIHRKYSETVCALRNGTVSSGNLKASYLNYKVLKGKLD